MVYRGPLQATGIAKSLPKCFFELGPKRRKSSCLAINTQREEFIFSLGPTDVPWDTGQAPLSPAGAPGSAGLPVPAAEGTGFDVTVQSIPRAVLPPCLTVWLCSAGRGCGLTLTEGFVCHKPQPAENRVFISLHS